MTGTAASPWHTAIPNGCARTQPGKRRLVRLGTAGTAWCGRPHQARRLPALLPRQNTEEPRARRFPKARSHPQAPSIWQVSFTLPHAVWVSPGKTTRPPTFGPSKKRVCLRFNLRPQGSRQTSKSSTWDDVKGLYSDTLPVRFKTQTCAIFSRVAGSVDSNQLLLAPRTPHLHTFGGYNAPSVYQSRAQARDA